MAAGTLVTKSKVQAGRKRQSRSWGRELFFFFLEKFTFLNSLPDDSTKHFQSCFAIHQSFVIPGCKRHRDITFLLLFSSWWPHTQLFWRKRRADAELGQQGSLLQNATYILSIKICGQLIPILEWNIFKKKEFTL